MRTYIRRREKNDQLVIVYGSWGTDENVFVPLCNDDFDFILFTIILQMKHWFYLR